MPVVPSSFQPPFYLRNGHVQTLLGALAPRRKGITLEPERLELEDGDFLDLGWLRKGRGRVAILSHGLEGSAEDGYIRGMAAALDREGWDVLAWNYRGCGKEPNRLLRFYHSGETGDLGRVVRHAAAHWPRIALIGFSLGGNLMLKYLGEARPHPAVIGGAAISAPVDLASSARALDRRAGNRLYLSRFMKTLVAKVEAKALRFPGRLDASRSRAVRTFEEFDNLYTAPLHGFRDAGDYWAQSSARRYLPGLTLPALLLNALDDPFLTPECFPSGEADHNPRLLLETPPHGGHLGFIDLKRGFQPWYERRVTAFLSEL